MNGFLLILSDVPAEHLERQSLITLSPRCIHSGREEANAGFEKFEQVSPVLVALGSQGTLDSKNRSISVLTRVFIKLIEVQGFGINKLIQIICTAFSR